MHKAMRIMIAAGLAGSLLAGCEDREAGTETGVGEPGAMDRGTAQERNLPAPATPPPDAPQTDEFPDEQPLTPGGRSPLDQPPQEPDLDEPGLDEPAMDEPGWDEPGMDEPGMGEPGMPGTGERVQLEGVTLRAPQNWERQQPEQATRAAEFQVPAEGGGEEATLIVYYFGPEGAGTAEDNIQRWIGQFEQPDGSPSDEVAQTEQRTFAGMSAHTVSLSGTYVAQAVPGEGEPMNEEGWALRGVVLETESGPYYFKLVGPEETVQAAEQDLWQMLESAEQR